MSLSRSAAIGVMTPMFSSYMRKTFGLSPTPPSSGASASRPASAPSARAPVADSAPTVGRRVQAVARAPASVDARSSTPNSASDSSARSAAGSSPRRPSTGSSASSRAVTTEGRPCFRCSTKMARSAHLSDVTSITRSSSGPKSAAGTGTTSTGRLPPPGGARRTGARCHHEGSVRLVMLTNFANLSSNRRCSDPNAPCRCLEIISSAMFLG